jgi:hypothetical protein
MWSVDETSLFLGMEMNISYRFLYLAFSLLETVRLVSYGIRMETDMTTSKLYVRMSREYIKQAINNIILTCQKSKFALLIALRQITYHMT